jgi:hypothetical protein
LPESILKGVCARNATVPHETDDAFSRSISAFNAIGKHPKNWNKQLADALQGCEREVSL